MPGFGVEWLGTVPYGDAARLQAEAVEARRCGATEDRLLLLEHPPVVTLGSATHAENLLLDPDALAARGIERYEARRGGDVTYHGPGQLVGYLIVDLAARGARDVHRFLRAMEGALIDASASLGVAARRIEGMTGVFVDRGSASVEARERKLASIGIGVRHWVTYHGFALNVSVDLKGFEVIVPCGLHGVEMTSLARELEPEARGAALDEAARVRVASAFEGVFASYPE